MIVEDTSALWRENVFAELRARGYKVASRTRLNVMLER